MKCRYLGNLGTSEQPRSKADADAQGGSGSRKCLGLLVIGTRAFGRSWTSGGTATRSSFVIFLGTIERGFFGDFRMSWRLEAGTSYLDSYTHRYIYIYIICMISIYHYISLLLKVPLDFSHGFTWSHHFPGPQIPWWKFSSFVAVPCPSKYQVARVTIPSGHQTIIELRKTPGSGARIDYIYVYILYEY